MNSSALSRVLRSHVSVIAFFGHDVGEPTVVKRLTRLIEEGCRVIGFTFRRKRPDAGLTVTPIWTNIDLGPTTDRNYIRRVPRLAMALPKILKRRDLLARADILYARNL